MAIGLQNLENVDPPDDDYPFGKVRDNDGTGNGTPANTRTLGDFHQFFAKLLEDAVITPNGMPESAYSGFQYNEALFGLGYKNSAEDLNNITRFGVYGIEQGIANGPAGLGTFSQLIVTAVVGFQVHQRIVDLVNGAEWSRIYSAGVWYNWVLIKDAEYTYDIGGWDLAGGGNRQFNHGLGASLPTLLTGIDVMILNNGLTLSQPYNTFDYSVGTEPECNVYVNQTQVVIGVNTGGSWLGNPAYAGTAASRGWVKIRKRPA
jgi:hypothetical protein